MPTVQEVAEMIRHTLTDAMSGEEAAAEATAETTTEEGAEAEAPAPETDYLEEIGRDEYHEAMEMVMDSYQVPEEMREPVYEHLDAEGDYSAAGLRQNLDFVLENSDITNQIDNSLNVGDGGEGHYDSGIHGDVTNVNETNVANATGDSAIAGRDQDGQFQTGDGVQVGDYNEGVVNQGDNSGVQGGDYASADDVTTGDGNFVNDGEVSENAIAFGGGDATNQADDIYDASTNDSFNEDNVGNTTDSFNEDNVGNSSYESEQTVDANLHADVDVTEYETDDHQDDHYDHGHDGYEQEAIHE